MSISDLDGDQVSLSVPVKPDWLNLENGSLVGTPSLNDGGLHSVFLNANDGNGGIVSQEYAISLVPKKYASRIKRLQVLKHSVHLGYINETQSLVDKRRRMYTPSDSMIKDFLEMTESVSTFSERKAS